ncbi:beta-propeller domain-containing protein, partial [Geoglobus sp.]
MKKLILALTMLSALILAGCITSDEQIKPTPTPSSTKTPYTKQTPEILGENVSGLHNLARFKSEDEMREYLASRQIYYGYPTFGFAVQKGMPEPLPAGTPVPMATPTPTPVPTPMTEERVAGRYSETNVQVKGIDEPDIVKTDGKNIYYSIGMARIYMPRIIMPEYYGKILSVRAFPPDNMSVSFEIPKDGNLLLHKDRLIVLRYNEISGYDRENGKNVWRIDVDGNIVTARLYGDYIFVITRSYLDYYDPCPVEPVKINGEALEVRCTDIYFPRGIDSEVLYTVMKVNPESGEVEKTFSFMGTYGSTVYMSENAIYVAYTKRMGEDEIYFKFLQENRDLLPDDVLSRIEKVMGYDISNQAKFIEIQSAISKYLLTLDKEERLKFENDFWNRM